MIANQLQKRYLVLIALSLVLALSLVACGGDKPTPTVVPTQPSATATTAAAPVQEAKPTAQAAKATQPTSTVLGPASPLNAPESPLPTPAAQAKPTDQTGSLQGRILIARPNGDIPVANVTLGLADVIRNEQGVAKVSGYELTTPNQAQTDAYGRFVLNNLKPGAYTLILDAVVLQHQLNNPQTGQTLMVDIKAGETVDIGTLRYDKIPLPGLP